MIKNYTCRDSAEYRRGPTFADEHDEPVPHPPPPHHTPKTHRSPAGVPEMRC